MNVALPIAAVMLDLGFSSDAVKSVHPRAGGGPACASGRGAGAADRPSGRRSRGSGVEYEPSRE